MRDKTLAFIEIIIFLILSAIFIYIMLYHHKWLQPYAHIIQEITVITAAITFFTQMLELIIGGKEYRDNKNNDKILLNQASFYFLDNTMKIYSDFHALDACTNGDSSASIESQREKETLIAEHLKKFDEDIEQTKYCISSKRLQRIKKLSKKILSRDMDKVTIGTLGKELIKLGKKSKISDKEEYQDAIKLYECFKSYVGADPVDLYYLVVLQPFTDSHGDNAKHKEILLFTENPDTPGNQKKLHDFMKKNDLSLLKYNKFKKLLSDEYLKIILNKPERIGKNISKKHGAIEIEINGKSITCLLDSFQLTMLPFI